MKKLFTLFAAAAMIVSFSSCKKSGTCTCEAFGISTSQDYDDLKKDQYDALKTTCESSSICKWSDK